MLLIIVSLIVILAILDHFIRRPKLKIVLSAATSLMSFYVGIDFYFNGSVLAAVVYFFLSIIELLRLAGFMRKQNGQNTN